MLGHLLLLRAILEADRCSICAVRRATTKGRCRRCNIFFQTNGRDRDVRLFA